MIYKLHKNGAYNIHTIKTDRFKNIRMEIIFRNNINTENIVERTVLFDMLMENSENYKTKRDLILKSEELYNAACFAVTYKVGNQVISSICMDFLNPKHTRDNYLNDAIKLPFDLIFKPNVKDMEFDEETLDNIKLRSKDDLLHRNEDAVKLSLFNALQAMDKTSVSSVHILGTPEKIDAVTKASLYKTYQDILTHDYIDIYVIGDINEDKIVDLIDKYAKFNTIKNHELDLYVNNKIALKKKEVTEKSKFSQSQVVCIYNTTDLTEEEKKYAMRVYNMILGGASLDSKLYKNLRGKNSLCYNVISIYNKYDNLLMVRTSVDKTNVNKSLKLIDDSIKEMQNNINDEDVKKAVSSIITSLNMSLDSPGRIIDDYMFRNIAGLDDIEERIKKYKEVKVADVKSICKKIKINTIYVLEGDSNGKN